MSLPVEEFPVICRAIVGCGFLAGPRRTVVRPDPAMMSRLLKVHKAVGRLAHDAPDLLDLAQVRRALEHQLAYIMVRCLAEGAGVETTMGIIRH